MCVYPNVCPELTFLVPSIFNFLVLIFNIQTFSQHPLSSFTALFQFSLIPLRPLTMPCHTVGSSEPKILCLVIVKYPPFWWCLPRIRITGCAETRLFTLFSRLAQAEKWTKTKGFCCSCNLYFLVPTFDSCFGKHSFGLKTLWDFCLILNQLNCKIIVLIKPSIWDKDIQYTLYSIHHRQTSGWQLPDTATAVC